MSVRSLAIHAAVLLVLLLPLRAGAVTQCGYEGERACCAVGEQGALPTHSPSNPGCALGLFEAPGCAGTASQCACQYGLWSSGTCMRPTACGALGQRACQWGDNPGPPKADPKCQAGLHPILGCSGNCYTEGPPHHPDAHLSKYTCALPDPAPLISEPETGFRNGVVNQCSLRGYADLHAHMFNEDSSGGAIFGGQAWSPDGINDALRSCYKPRPGDNLRGSQGDHARFYWHGDHTIFDLPTAVGTGDQSDGNLGAPYFNSWPKWKSTVHQNMYWHWLKRAWHGGLRLMVMMAASNEALCLSSPHYVAIDGDPTRCDEPMKWVDKQIKDAYAFQAWVDEQSSGPGKGWFRIVKSPEEARQAMIRGQLAVVLGIEVDNLFGCKELGSCTEQDIKTAVQTWYAKGVRHFFPIHNFDNAFGAAATWQDVIALGNAVSERRWYDVEDCSNQGYRFWLSRFNIGFAILAGELGLGFPAASLPPTGPPSDYLISNPWGVAHCNRRGLFDKGELLLSELMKRGLIIDVDHMSVHSLERTLELTHAKKYPVVASHVLAFDLHNQKYDLANNGKHERLRRRDHLERIRDDGGMVAMMLKDDVQDSGLRGKPVTSSWGTKVADSCLHSSRSWAQEYLYAKEIMGNGIAFGSDFNGVAGHLGPRFGSDGCSGIQDPFNNHQRSEQERFSTRLKYPFTIPGFGDFLTQYTGYKQWDYNVDGLAHVGLLPDLVADLKVVGLSDDDLKPLFKSAEEYVKVWERAIEAGTGAVPPQHALPLCAPITVSADNSCSAAGWVWSASAFLDPDTEFTQSPPGPYPIGTTEVLVTATSPNGCAAPVTCKTTVTVVDTSGPNLFCPRSDTVVECQGKETPAGLPHVPPPQDACSPPASPLVCDAPASGLYPYGSTTVTCSSHDALGNVHSCSMDVLVQDTTPPVIYCPPATQIECNTGGRRAGTPFTPGNAKASDSCGLVSVQGPPAGFFPLGMTQLTYVATDLGGNTTTCQTDLTVIDTRAPEITAATAIPERLWPANGRLRNIAVEVSAKDSCSRTPRCSISSVTVPAEKVPPDDDIRITGPLTLQLRAALVSGRTDRNYVIGLVCTDDGKNAAYQEVSVRVAAK